jgi:HlyD family secretion protein
LEEAIILQKESQPFTKPVGQWVLILAAAMALATGGVYLYGFSRFRFNAQGSISNSQESVPAIVAVTALGRLEPQGEVTRLSAPNSLANGGARVEKLLVEEGDKVRAGQVIALLDEQANRLAALEQAKQQVKVAQARLAKVKAGTQDGEIAAQKAAVARLSAELRGEIAAQEATIGRLQVELSNAQAEYQRHQELYRQGVISASLFDSKRLPVETLQQQIKEAKATKNRTVESLEEQISQAKATLSAKAEVRPVDVQVVQAEVDSALVAVKQAQANLDLTYVRSPIDGQILKIHTRPGEIVTNEGIADLGQTDRMYVVAEIYQTDIEKVRVGQRSTITGEAFSGKLQGTVTHIGLQVDRQNVFNVNPGSDTDRKVVEVKIRIDNPADSQQVAGLTNLQVEVTIPI